MNVVKFVAVLILGAALFAFGLSNYETGVHIYFLTMRTVEIPLSLALAGAFAVGLLLAVVLSIPNQLRLRSRIRDMRRKTDRLEREIAELRKLPLDDPLPEERAAGKGPAGMDTGDSTKASSTGS